MDNDHLHLKKKMDSIYFMSRFKVGASNGVYNFITLFKKFKKTYKY